MVKELTRVLRSDGELIVVLPYPDTGTQNDPAHGAKYELGTNVEDGGMKVVSFFARHPLRLTSKEFDDFRETRRSRCASLGWGDTTWRRH